MTRTTNFTKFTSLMVAMAFMLGLAVTGCSDSDRDGASSVAMKAIKIAFGVDANAKVPQSQFAYFVPSAKDKDGKDVAVKEKQVKKEAGKADAQNVYTFDLHVAENAKTIDLVFFDAQGNATYEAKDIAITPGSTETVEIKDEDIKPVEDEHALKISEKLPADEAAWEALGAFSATVDAGEAVTFAVSKLEATDSEVAPVLVDKFDLADVKFVPADNNTDDDDAQAKDDEEQTYKFAIDSETGYGSIIVEKAGKLTFSVKTEDGETSETAEIIANENIEAAVWSPEEDFDLEVNKTQEITAATNDEAKTALTVKLSVADEDKDYVTIENAKVTGKKVTEKAITITAEATDKDGELVDTKEYSVNVTKEIAWTPDKADIKLTAVGDVLKIEAAYAAAEVTTGEAAELTVELTVPENDFVALKADTKDTLEAKKLMGEQDKPVEVKAVAKEGEKEVGTMTYQVTVAPEETTVTWTYNNADFPTTNIELTATVASEAIVAADKDGNKLTIEFTSTPAPTVGGDKEGYTLTFAEAATDPIAVTAQAKDAEGNPYGDAKTFNVTVNAGA